MRQSSYYGSFLCRVGVADRAPSLLQPVMVHKKTHIEWSFYYGSFLCRVGVAKGVSLLSLKLMVHKKDPYRIVILLWVFLM